MEKHYNWGLSANEFLIRELRLEDFDNIKPLYSNVQFVPDFDMADMLDGERFVFVLEEVATKNPVVIAGLEPIWEGRWAAWLYPSESFKRHYRSVFKATVQILDKFFSEYEVRRLEATVPVNFPEGRRWLEHLGFDVEGMLRRYDLDGEAHYQYSKVDWDGGQCITS
ncbi:MAG: GNAT family N-acetyltransferase [Shewanella sp.]|nr:GNAT family N-acetyltransferase [Shewanella sp.]